MTEYPVLNPGRRPRSRRHPRTLRRLHLRRRAVRGARRADGRGHVPLPRMPEGDGRRGDALCRLAGRSLHVERRNPRLRRAELLPDMRLAPLPSARRARSRSCSAPSTPRRAISARPQEGWIIRREHWLAPIAGRAASTTAIPSAAPPRSRRAPGATTASTGGSIGTRTMPGSSAPGGSSVANWLASRLGGMKWPFRSASRAAIVSFDPSRKTKTTGFPAPSRSRSR